MAIWTAVGTHLLHLVGEQISPIGFSVGKRGLGMLKESASPSEATPTGDKGDVGKHCPCSMRSSRWLQSEQTSEAFEMISPAVWDYQANFSTTMLYIP